MQRELTVTLVAAGAVLSVASVSAVERRALTQAELDMAAQYLPADSQNCVPHNFKPGDNTLHGCDAYKVLEAVGYTSHIIKDDIVDEDTVTAAAQEAAPVIESYLDEAAEVAVVAPSPAVETEADTTAVIVEEPGDAAATADAEQQEQPVEAEIAAFEPAVTPDATGVQFAFDESLLSDEAKASLAAFAEQFKAAQSPATIRVSGYTDTQGDAAYNEILSTKRAQSVASFLQEQGISADKIQTAGLGSSEPVAENETQQGRAMNRRVELEIVE